MTQTDLLDILKMELGSSHRPLELDDNELMKIVKLRTIPTFSNYFPLFQSIEVIPTRDIVKQGQWGTYFLRSDLIIKGVAKVFTNENAVMFRNQYGTNITNIFDLQMFSDALSAVYTPETWQFHPPCTLELFPKYYNISDLLVICKVEHPEHLTTIKESLWDEFVELAIADVKIALYPIRKRFSSTNSTYGNIELDLEILEGGKEERKEILERWRQNFIKEPERKKIWVY